MAQGKRGGFNRRRELSRMREQENGDGTRQRVQPTAGREQHPATQHHDPTRYVGTVVRVKVAEGFSFIRDGANIEYFAHKSVYTPPELFERAADGTERGAVPLVVSFYRTETTKGWRAAGVRAADEAEAATIEPSDDSRGNR